MNVARETMREGEKMAVEQELNERERKFCEVFADCKSKAEAYIKAGYTAKDVTVASAGANRLLKKVKILAEIRRIRDENAAPYIMTINERKKWLIGIMEDENASRTEKLKAMDLLNKMEGVYETKLRVGGEGEGGALLIAWRSDKPPEAENVTTIESTE